MADLVVIVPSRGRPAQLARLVDAVRSTTGGRAEVFALLDEDDPALGDYRRIDTRVHIGPRRGLVEWTNIGAHLVLAATPTGVLPPMLASMGDDHVPRTVDWDARLVDSIDRLAGPGWAYGNDLLQGARLPTAWVVHPRVVAALGWLMMPRLGHMYPDNVIADLGTATGRLAYRPDVIIEHLHPAAGKAPVDASYELSNRPAQFEQDHRAYQLWRELDYDDEVRAVAALSWERAPCR